MPKSTTRTTSNASTQTGTMPRVEVEAKKDQPMPPNSLPEVAEPGSTTGRIMAVNLALYGENGDSAKEADDSVGGSDTK